MIDFQSIQTTTDASSPPRTARTALAMPALLATRTTVAFVDDDSMVIRHSSRGWTLAANGKSPHKTSEGDSNTLDDFRVQDTEIEVTAAISA